MLGKLLKYDLKFVYKVVAVFYILAFGGLLCLIPKDYAWVV